MAGEARAVIDTSRNIKRASAGEVWRHRPLQTLELRHTLTGRAPLPVTPYKEADPVRQLKSRNGGRIRERAATLEPHPA